MVPNIPALLYCVRAACLLHAEVGELRNELNQFSMLRAAARVGLAAAVEGSVQRRPAVSAAGEPFAHSRVKQEMCAFELTEKGRMRKKTSIIKLMIRSGYAPDAKVLG